MGVPFIEFWAAYPKRQGANPKAPAETKFLRAVASGVDAKAIINGARVYAEHCVANKITNTPYVAQAVTWLNQKRWEDYTDDKPKIDFDAVAAAHGYKWDDNQGKYIKLGP